MVSPPPTHFPTPSAPLPHTCSRHAIRQSPPAKRTHLCVADLLSISLSERTSAELSKRWPRDSFENPLEVRLQTSAHVKGMVHRGYHAEQKSERDGSGGSPQDVMSVRTERHGCRTPGAGWLQCGYSGVRKDGDVLIPSPKTNEQSSIELSSSLPPAAPTLCSLTPPDIPPLLVLPPAKIPRLACPSPTVG